MRVSSALGAGVTIRYPEDGQAVVGREWGGSGHRRWGWAALPVIVGCHGSKDPSGEGQRSVLFEGKSEGKTRGRGPEK